jgi:hypothetical protein
MAITKINTPELFDLGSTNTSLRLPSGNTASRPASPSAGEWRYNTDDNKVEYYDGSNWFQIDDEASFVTPSKNFNVNTYNGNRPSTQTIDAKFNEAAAFNGSSSGITSSSLGTALNVSSLSFSLWFKTNLNDSTDRILISSYDGTGNARFYVSLLNSGLSVVIYGSSSTYIQNFINTVTIGTWYHLSVTHTGTTTTVYLNGTAITPSSTSGSAVAIKIAGSPQPLTMGQLQGNIGTYSLNGSIDQVRFFNTALTQQNVNDLYNNETTDTAGVLNFPAGAGCIAAYQLDGDASDVGGTYGGVPTDIGYTGLQFQPDFIWIKNRDSSSYPHVLTDSVRGNTKYLESNSSSQELTSSNGIISFDSNGFSLGNDGYFNGGASGANNEMVAWCFNAGEGSSALNEQGSIDSTVKANQDAGFSIVKYTGNGTAGATIGHGLTSLTPSLIIWKNLDATSNWLVYSPLIGSDSEWLYLNLTSSKQDSGNTNEYPTNKVNPTSSVVTVNGSGSSNNINISGQDTIMYCFADIAGYQKIGSYTGTGTAGNNVVTDFEPAFLMVKRVDSADNWLVFDNKRNPTNPTNLALVPNNSAAESVGNLGNGFSFLSNGFQVVSTDTGVNANGGSYIYLAIAADAQPAPVLANSFSPTLYTGNGGTQSIATDFKPDLVWVKSRSFVENHAIFDSVRGVQKEINSNRTNAESTKTNALSSFNSSGFTTGANNALNANNEDYVAWCWKAGGLPTINNNGDITSIVSVNQAAGFSIVKYKGNEQASQTVEHGLNGSPEIAFIKQLDGGRDWAVPLFTQTSGDYMYLNSSQAESTDTNLWSAVSSTTFTVGADPYTNGAGSPYIGYFFKSISGYSKVGTYNGTGITDSFTNFGFQPSWILIKRINGSGGNWWIFDSSRGNNKGIRANLSNQEDTTDAGSNTYRYLINFETDGFEYEIVGGTAAHPDINASGGTYIYLAIA